MTEALGQAGIEPAAVQAIAVGLGPGSYTGIRVAIALAQSLELGLGARLTGLSSVECLVWGAWLEGIHGEVAVVVDAQRGERYAARYQISPLGVELRQPLGLQERAEVQRWADRGVILVGPDLEDREPAVRPLYPEAAMLGVLATGTTGYVPGPELAPIYLRATQFMKAPPPRQIPPPSV
jgi:tRNA threonylcarbamoyl adenosine modification protein YeaZ